MSVQRVIKIEISGMKGLEKRISFQFQNDTIQYTTYAKNPSVKAIFGANGSGKSSFITALDAYKGICESGFYLVSDSSSKMLSRLINKNSKAFSINIWFANCEENATYRHYLVIDNSTSKPFVSQESLSRLIGKTINEEERTILEMKAGNLMFFSETSSTKNKSDALDGYVRKAMEKMNHYSSFVSLFSDINFLNGMKECLPSEKATWNKDSVFGALLYLSSFIAQISVYMAASDIHTEIDEELYSFMKQYLDRDLENNPIFWKGNAVAKSRIEAYERQVEKMAGFIKLFKPGLQSIEVEKREEESVYLCKLIMQYDGFGIDSEYESTGIKNLMSMFNALEKASKGGISFIDEMDANMNEVYLARLCEYFTKYAKGQLCFTTHNTAPMRILKRKARGIDFINGNADCIEWKRSGNASPSRLYSEGMIVGIPYNVDDFEFINVFDR